MSSGLREMLTWGRAPTELQMPLSVPSGDNQERSGTITQVEAGCLREAGVMIETNQMASVHQALRWALSIPS